MKKVKKIFLIGLIFLIGVIFFKIKYKSFDKEKLPVDWKKDAKTVMEVYINAINMNDKNLRRECVFKMDGYDYSYIGFNDDIEYPWDLIYIKYINSKEVPFRTVEGRMKNGKSIYFKNGKTLDVTYKIRYIFNNKPDKSGINDLRYTLIKNKDGEYKIIECGY